MKFWKFEAPPADQIEALVAKGRLPPPMMVAGLRDTHYEVSRKLRLGDGVVLANLRGDEGKIVAFGKVRTPSGADEDAHIQWAIASHGVHPTGSGLNHWRTKTAFEISTVPAKRYGLLGFIEYYIPDVAQVDK